MIDSFVTSNDIDKEIKERGISENQIINICKSEECAEKTVYYKKPEDDSKKESIIDIIKSKNEEYYDELKSYLIHDIGIKFIIENVETPTFSIQPDSVKFEKNYIVIEIIIKPDLIPPVMIDKNVTAVEIYGSDISHKSVLITRIEDNFNPLYISSESSYVLQHKIELISRNTHSISTIQE